MVSSGLLSRSTFTDKVLELMGSRRQGRDNGDLGPCARRLMGKVAKLMWLVFHLLGMCKAEMCAYAAHEHP
jgi:hypothetical protein